MFHRFFLRRLVFFLLIGGLLFGGARALTPDQIKAEFPFMMVDDLVLGSLNTRDEGYFDGSTVFDWFHRKAREAGVEYVADEVVGLDLSGAQVTGVRLKSGRTVGCGTVVNASGTRVAKVAAMAVDSPSPGRPDSNASDWPTSRMRAISLTWTTRDASMRVTTPKPKKVAHWNLM